MGQVGTFFFFNFWEYFLWRLCAFLNKGSSKAPKKLFGESPCEKLLAKKVERIFFPAVFSHRFFLNRVFGRFSA
jgi:hypothetical protein